MKKILSLLSTSPDLLTYPNPQQDYQNTKGRDVDDQESLHGSTRSQPTIALLPFGDVY
jgi:hypothetical protein